MSPAADPRDQLSGKLLIAMPTMPDPRFQRRVIFLCAHSEDGAMGLIINQVAANLTFPRVLGQLGIEVQDAGGETPLYVGGPVETSRGFVLHTADYVRESTLVIDDTFALTATIDVLKAIATGEGPARRVLALGYSGWAAGQLDAEIHSNGWLIAPADAEIVFDRSNDTKWLRALNKIGVDPSLLSSTAGHA